MWLCRIDDKWVEALGEVCLFEHEGQECSTEEIAESVYQVMKVITGGMDVSKIVFNREVTSGVPQWSLCIEGVKEFKV
jgi:hypothetical protein